MNSIALISHKFNNANVPGTIHTACIKRFFLFSLAIQRYYMCYNRYNGYHTRYFVNSLCMWDLFEIVLRIYKLYYFVVVVGTLGKTTCYPQHFNHPRQTLTHSKYNDYMVGPIWMLKSVHPTMHYLGIPTRKCKIMTEGFWDCIQTLLCWNVA